MAQRLRAFLQGVGGRLWTLLQGIGLRRALTGVAVLSALALLALLALSPLFSILYLRQEAAEQQPGKEEVGPPKTWAEDFPLIFSSGEGSEPATEATSVAERRSRGIPGASAVDIVAYLRYVPGTDFRCSSSPTRRVCRSSSEEPPGAYEVVVVSDVGAVLSVVATARDASDEEAARVLGEVARLAVGDLGPLDPEAFVERSISSGGQYLGEGAEVRLYGVQGDRTLEIVGAGLPTDTEPRPAKGSKPKADQGKLDDALDEALDEAFGKTDSKAGAPGKTTAGAK